MFPASLAAWVPVFIATPTSAWASAGASLVPSPVIATRLPPACSRLISAILSSGVASARKSSTPASCGDRGAVERVVAGDHHRADAHGAAARRTARACPASPCPSAGSRRGPAAAPPLAVDDDQRRGAVVGDAARRSGRSSIGTVAALVDARTCAPSRRRPCGPCGRRRSPCPLMRVWAVNGTSTASGSSGTHEAVARRRRARRSSDPSGVSSARLDSMRRLGQLAARRRRAPGTNSAAWREPNVIVPGLVEQQRVHVAGRLDGPARHGQHVALHQPVHAGDADGRQQRRRWSSG